MITNDEKSAAFKRLAVKRMNKFIKAARLIANLGNKNSYIGSPQEKQKIINCAKSELNNIDNALTTGNVQAEGFSFD